MKLLLAILLVVISACSIKTPHSELNKTVIQMVTLIDEGKTQELLENHIDLSSLPDGNTQINEIPASKLKRLRFYLLRAQEITPEFTKTNTLATYNDPLSKKTMMFKKIDGKWLLIN